MRVQIRTTKPLMKRITANQFQDKPSWRTYIRQALILVLSSFSIILLTSQVTKLEQVVGEYLGQPPPGSTSELFAEGIIPDDLHSTAVFSGDGKTLYYKPMDEAGIMVMRMKKNKWSAAVPLFVNGEADNSDDPCLSPTGEKLFFSRYNKEENREYIYYCLQKNAGKCIPMKPAGDLNALDLHWQFSVVENENIYFSSNGNIYCSVYSNEGYLEPYKLDSTINSGLSECTPYVNPDESMLIFSRSNAGKPDLFVSYKDKDGKWQEARSLGAEVNTEHHEMCPSISPDGKYLFFISSRGGLFSVYWVDASVLDKS